MPVEPDPNLLWYIVHAYAGHETKVRDSLMARIGLLGLQDSISEVRVPAEGRQLMYPGYVLVKMAMRDETLRLVKAIPKVTGFVGGARPTPLSQAEIEQILGTGDAVAAATDYAPGDAVRVVDGAFAGFGGVVEQVGDTVRVRVTIHGRSTVAELSYRQIEKA